MSLEYKVLYRLIYNCGLRNSEACNLTWINVELNRGYLKIIHSKNDKNRIVYISDDMLSILRKYQREISEKASQSIWVFPGLNPLYSIPKTLVDRKFNEIWNKTKFANQCDKKPTVHCFRHTFVIKRMNLRMNQGVDLNTMMPYLSKYLGHKSRGETFYYYHQINEAFHIINKKDTQASLVIPEVIDYD